MQKINTDVNRGITKMFVRDLSVILEAELVMRRKNKALNDHQENDWLKAVNSSGVFQGLLLTYFSCLLSFRRQS